MKFLRVWKVRRRRTWLMRFRWYGAPGVAADHASVQFVEAETLVEAIAKVIAEIGKGKPEYAKGQIFNLESIELVSDSEIIR